MLTLLIEALFALMFVRAGVAYARTRDPVQRDVMLVFSAVASILLLTVATELWGAPPEPVVWAVLVLLLGQPYLTLRMVAQLGPVRRWVRWTTLISWLGTSGAFVLAGTPTPRPLVLATVATFAFGQVAAAWYLVRAARRRAGSAAFRLWCAAAGTVLFAAAIVVSAGNGTAGRVLSLLSAAGYVLAFLPPRWLRDVWSARAAYALVRDLLTSRPDEPSQQTWQRYAAAVRRVSSADAAVVMVPTNDHMTEVGWSGRGTARDLPHPAADIAGLLSTTGATDVTGRPKVPGRGRDASSEPAPSETVGVALACELADRADARFVTAVPVRLPDGRTGALVLLDRHRSLFGADDAALLGELGAQAAVLADREALTAQLADAAARAAAASQAKSDFLASMSHELRTPLNAIIGFSELMGHEQEHAGSRTVPTEWIDHIYGSGRHLLGLINDVLDLSKVEAGRIELRREPVELDAAVAEALTALRPLLDQKQLRATVAVPPLTVPADPVRLRQVLDNLLSNAIKFTPEEGRISVVGRRVGTQVHLSVIDNGPGIDPVDHQRVFEEFHQVGDPTKHKAGTGLGLALARRLIEAHGGHIELESRPGQGARFTIVLPTPGHSDGGPTHSPDAAAFRGGILMIEDDPAAIRLIAAQLRRTGYRVTAVRTGEEGLVAAHACPPDAVLLDVLLPGIDGWAVLRRLKADERLRHVPVAVVTVVDDRQVAGTMDAMDYFVKPVGGERLLAWLARQGFPPPAVPAGSAARPPS